MQLSALYPSVHSLLAGTSFDADWAKAIEVARGQGERAFYDLTLQRGLASNLLTHFLGSPHLTSYKDTQRDSAAFENDLSKLTDALGPDRVRSVFRDKLLVDGQFEDTRYEIAVATTLLDFFDSGTLELEVPIPNTPKNSDIAGSRGGHQYRVEVTVIHEDWPPITANDVQQALESADLPTGYSVLLRRPVEYLADARGVAEAITAVFACRDRITDEGFDVAGGTAWPDDNDGRFHIDDGPIAEIEFHDDDPTIRIVTQPARTRATMEQSEREQLHVPGTVNTASLLVGEPTHNDRPVSTKVWDAVGRKRKQCVPQALNIVALGQPKPWDDHAVIDGLYGVGFSAFERDSSGQFGEATRQRKGSGPFTPAQFSENLAEFVNPYRVLSAVWAFRLSSAYPLSRVLLNPNAAAILPESEKAMIEKLGQARAGC